MLRLGRGEHGAHLLANARFFLRVNYDARSSCQPSKWLAIIHTQSSNHVKKGERNEKKMKKGFICALRSSSAQDWERPPKPWHWEGVDQRRYRGLLARDKGQDLRRQCGVVHDGAPASRAGGILPLTETHSGSSLVRLTGRRLPAQKRRCPDARCCLIPLDQEDQEIQKIPLQCEGNACPRC